MKLLDFSIAKLMQDEDVPRLTQDGGAVLTPRYAAPEQVTGGPITTATDVYSLGVLLYELLSGQHPYGGARHLVRRFHPRDRRARTAAAEHGVSATPRRNREACVAAQRGSTPERLERALGSELETILHKTLKKSPAERYGSVAELVDDLRRYLDDKPITARPDTARYRAAKFVRRHRRGIGLTAAASPPSSCSSAVYAMQLMTERDGQRLQAEKARRVSELLTSVLLSADPYRDPDPACGWCRDAEFARLARYAGGAHLQRTGRSAGSAG